MPLHKVFGRVLFGTKGDPTWLPRRAPLVLSNHVHGVPRAWLQPAWRSKLPAQFARCPPGPLANFLQLSTGPSQVADLAHIHHTGLQGQDLL